MTVQAASRVHYPPRDDINEPSFTDMLRHQAAQKQAEFLRLTHEQKRIEIHLQKLRSYIEHLNVILEAEGLPQISLREPTQGTGFAQPGNRAKNMPLRKSEWDGMTLGESVEAILDESDDIYHADVLVQRIYELETEADRKRAKHSLVGTLRQGVRDKRWKGYPGNRYQRLRAKQEALALT